jgi:hypothetical protein
MAALGARRESKILGWLLSRALNKYVIQLGHPMKSFTQIMFFFLVAALAVFVGLRGSDVWSPSPDPSQETAFLSQAPEPAKITARKSIRQVVPPDSQTTLLSDTDLENSLWESLLQNKELVNRAEIHSVNCEGLRCQVLAEPLMEDLDPQQVFAAHLATHPEFGRSLGVASVAGSNNTRLLTFTYSQETQVSATH